MLDFANAAANPLAGVVPRPTRRATPEEAAQLQEKLRVMAPQLMAGLSQAGPSLAAAMPSQQNALLQALNQYMAGGFLGG